MPKTDFVEYVMNDLLGEWKGVRAKGRAKPIVMSYWEVLAQVMDDREEVVRWAQTAWEVNFI